jgi:dolichol-phosphate mannosyltransferase
MTETVSAQPLPLAPKRISVVVPCFDEEDCVDELFKRLVAVLDSLQNYTFEVFLIDNGSRDRTWEKIVQIHETDRRFSAVRLSRNFQTDGGICAGLSFVEGDAVVIMSADLQDPPELIPTFIREWERGFENVYMVVTRRNGTSGLRRFNSWLFYKMIGRLSGDLLPRDASDFRLVDRSVYEVVRRFPERARLMRGLFSWAGFRSVGIPHERPERFGGVSKAGTIRIVNLAIRGILSFSAVPLRIVSLLGVVLSILSIVGIALAFVFWIALGVPFAGFGSIISLQLLLFSFTVLILGTIGEYVGLMVDEVKGRPAFIVRDLMRGSTHE